MPRPIKIDAPQLRLDPADLLERLSWVEVFGAEGSVEIEIGIGKGRFLLAAAAARPDVWHLGIEWANKYLRIAEQRAVRDGLDNVRFVRTDARQLLVGAIPTSSVSAYYIFYPDPWPKKRHHKRRLLQRDTIEHLARTLKPEGLLHIATDHEEYWEAMLPPLDGHPGLERLPQFGGERFPLPTDAPLTNFEAKYRIEGRGRNRASWIRRHRG